MEKLNNQLSISTAASLLMGAGISHLEDVNLALILIGIGAALKIIVSLLQKNGINVSADPSID